MTATTTQRPTTVETLRTYDRDLFDAICRGGGPRGQAEHDTVFCARCSCNKSGDASEPNGVTEACDDPSCLCHRDARCTCCDGHDGLGIHHFENVDQLRAFLAVDHEMVCDIDVANVPDEPWGVEFVTAGEAAAWLDEYDDLVTAAGAYG